MKSIETIIRNLRVAMTDARQNESHFESWMILNEAICDAIDALAERPAKQQVANKNGSPCPEFWDWLPKAYNFEGDGNFTKYNMEVAFLAGKQSVPAQQKTEFVSPGGGYVPAIPRPLPIDWKLVPRKATPEMLKAMDECAQEGYDERLYEGMASSVYMAAWDASPMLGTLPPSEKEKSMMLAEQKAEQPVAWMYDVARYGPSDVRGQQWRPAISRIKPHIHDLLVRDIIPLYTSTPSPKPWVGLTQHDINVAFDDTQEGGGFDEFARAIEAKLREKNA